MLSTKHTILELQGIEVQHAGFSEGRVNHCCQASSTTVMAALASTYYIGPIEAEGDNYKSGTLTFCVQMMQAK